MSVSAFISKRLSLRSGEKRSLSPAIVVAVAGVAVAFAVMMLSIAVVGGFKSEITRKIMGFDAQVSVIPLESMYGEDVHPLTYDDAMRGAVGDVVGRFTSANGDVSVALSAFETGVLKTEHDFMGVSFRAFGEGYDAGFEESLVQEGRLPDKDNAREIAISRAMADKLSLVVGDKVDAYFITGGTVRPRRFEVTGIYSSGFVDYDDLIAYASYDAVAGLLRLGENQGVRLDINGLEKDDIKPFAQALQGELNSCYARGTLSEAMAVNTVLNSGAAYFNWLALLDTNVVVILILMGCVSGFMLVTCVLILILQRVNMIGVLKALGGSDRQIRGIFMRLGARVILSGLAIGNAVSLCAIFVQWRWQLIPLDPESYYLTSVPVEFNVLWWIGLNVGVAALSYLLMLLPTGIISRMEPVRILRFE